MNTSRTLRARMQVAHAVANVVRNKFGFRGRGRIARATSRIILPASYGRIRCPTIYGFDLMMEKGTSEDVFKYGFYEPGTLDVMRRVLRDSDVFVDAGASIGLMSLFAARQVGPTGRVLSFEPLPLRYELLNESVALNGLSNVTPLNFGLGRKNRETTIYADRVSPSMVEQKGSSQGKPSCVKRLDEILRRENVKSVRMIKVDVEGFELEVLKGCEAILRSEMPPVLCVEYGVYGRSQSELAEFLRSLDKYECFQLTKGASSVSRLKRIENSQQFRANDNIFCIPTGMVLKNN